MKTNMTDLISRISQMQSDFDDLELKIRTNSTNTKIIELNGNEQTIEKSEDFEKNYNEYLRLSKIIPKLKGIVQMVYIFIFLLLSTQDMLKTI